MDRDRASAIAHAGIAFGNPIPEAVLDRFIDECALGERDHILDIGCGRGELLIRAVERAGCSAIGVDQSPRQIAMARDEATRRVPNARIEFRETSAGALQLDVRSFGLVACVGSTHAYGGLSDALAALTMFVGPGGRLLIGDGYWTEPPSARYLAGWGATADELPDLDAFPAVAHHRLEVSDHYLATVADWDAYEEPWLANLDAHVRDHPDDPDAAEMREWADSARARRRLGPGVLGFALVLATVPG